MTSFYIQEVVYILFVRENRNHLTADLNWTEIANFYIKIVEINFGRLLELKCKLFQEAIADGLILA